MINEEHVDSSSAESSCEDVLCLSDAKNIEKHRPMKEFDIVSGRYSYDSTVIKFDLVVL